MSKIKQITDNSSSSLFGKSSYFTYDVYPTLPPTPAPSRPTSTPTKQPNTPPPTIKDNSVNGSSSDSFIVVGAGAAAGFIVLALIGTLMVRYFSEKKPDEKWIETANSNTNNMIEMGRMDESDVSETAVAGADSDIPVAPYVHILSLFYPP